jgi:hypothetical protein
LFFVCCLETVVLSFYLFFVCCLETFVLSFCLLPFWHLLCLVV